MAKSLRASSKVKARNARRYNDKTDYAVTHAARLNAISSRLAQRVAAKEDAEEQASKAEDEMETEGQDASAAAAAAGDNDQGWYRLSSPLCSFSQIEQQQQQQKKERGGDVDALLLGLVDPDSIGFSDSESEASSDSSEEDRLSWLWEQQDLQ
ncbi:hypothetical protein FA10DRAFT_267004 [Acaromyces ingoldii]|uniref:DUF2423 domain-containing protein n=1 Tax=Acaromyces ingoldii TaxID=215250 RepID=A0A316YN23_9BASI|nr:hypothetical protein FA10DRAFT_267004 [Acaromyces ingoldii]PWN90552.1 hypothetical protein FA10DRAFT_267004 [Acaromyces ingoldii]